MKLRTTSLFSCLAVMVMSCAQNTIKKAPGFVEYNAVTIPIHEANRGKITFLSELVPVNEYQESDFVSNHEITENSELFIRAFLETSLTNYLHPLDTTLTADELARSGNYQLSFYVDGDLLYTENIVPGAGSPAAKHTNSILTVPLLSNEYTDFWSRFTWMRFYHRHGGAAALENGKHLLKIEIRPYLDSNGIIVGNLIAEGEIHLKLPTPPQISEAEKAVQPIRPQADWEVSNTQYDLEKIRALNEKIAQEKFKSITSIVVIKDGKLLIEEYFNGADRNTLHDTRSVGKSFASTLMGIAIQEDHLKNTEQTLGEFYALDQFSNHSAKKERVTLKSLLTMSSGFDGSDSNYDSPGHEEKMQQTDNWVDFTLNLPMNTRRKIGEEWDYFTAGVLLLGDIMNQTVPGGLEKYADAKLFKPLGISDYKWFYTPQNAPYMGGGLEMRTLDFAKYGQLYKNNGMWNGKQLLSSNWVKKTFTNYFVDTPNQQPYGFLFWNQTYTINNHSYEAFQCNGNGGNKVIVFNDLPLVVIVTATAYGQPYGHSQVDKMMENYILPAVINAESGETN